MAAAPMLNAPYRTPHIEPALARAAQLLGFAVVAVALAVVSWRGMSLNLPDVGSSPASSGRGSWAGSSIR